jgi:hypothetical protein
MNYFDPFLNKNCIRNFLPSKYFNNNNVVIVVIVVVGLLYISLRYHLNILQGIEF